MLNTTKILRKTNSKGQITLPRSFRAKMQSDTFLIEEKDGHLTITPAEIITGEEVLFDAVRDNNGIRIPIKDMVAVLKKDLAKQP